MNKYKVTITKEYTIDVTASDEMQAEAIAENFLDDAMLKGTEHYYQTGETIINAYDVTNTDDAHDSINK